MEKNSAPQVQNAIKGDYHVHSKYSGDCQNEIEGIVREAIEIGLTEIAITDHGPKHSFYGINKSDYPEIRSVIDGLNVKYPEINILLGLECNILTSNGGKLDISDEMLEINDIIIAGYHFGSDMRKDTWLHAMNFLSKFSKIIYKKASKKNTDIIVKAMLENDIDILTHPGAKGPIDIEKIAMTAEKTNTILEINNGHGHLTVEDIRIAMKYDVKFATNSDAHKLERIGRVPNSLDRAREAGLSKSRIINIVGR